MTASSSLRRTRILGWALLVLLPGTVSAESWRLKIEGQDVDLHAAPVVAELDASVPAGNYRLQPTSGDKAALAQVFVDNGHTYLATVLDHIAAHANDAYTLEPASQDVTDTTGIALRREGNNVLVSTGGKPFTVYRTDAGPKPFYYPILGPTGTAYTRSYPMQNVEGEDKDHPHQRSLWFTHGKVNGVDFWSEGKGHGSIQETTRKTEVGGSAIGLIRTTDDWLTAEGKKVCDDERVVRFFNTGTTRIIDFDITLHASHGDLTFGDTKEGMFGLRVASSMDVTRKKGGKITNAEGLTDDKAWGKPSPWVDYTGPVEGQTVGIAVLNHPSSFRYPTTWHVRTYGLFAANPFGWHDFGRGTSGEYVLPSGQSVNFRYRIIFHTGDTASAQLTTAFQAYANPPKISVERDASR